VTPPRYIHIAAEVPPLTSEDPLPNHCVSTSIITLLNQQITKLELPMHRAGILG